MSNLSTYVSLTLLIWNKLLLNKGRKRKKFYTWSFFEYIWSENLPDSILFDLISLKTVRANKTNEIIIAFHCHEKINTLQIQNQSFQWLQFWTLVLHIYHPKVIIEVECHCSDWLCLYENNSLIKWRDWHNGKCAIWYLFVQFLYDKLVFVQPNHNYNDAKCSLSLTCSCTTFNTNNWTRIHRLVINRGPYYCWLPVWEQ